MNIDRLIAYTRDPSTIGQDDTEDLEQLLADYPYFTAAQHLLALKYRKQNSSRYNRQAQRAACQAPDQLRLAFLLEEPLAQWSSQLKTWTEEGLNVVPQLKVVETTTAEVSAEDTATLGALVEEVVIEASFDEASTEAVSDLEQTVLQTSAVDTMQVETEVPELSEVANDEEEIASLQENLMSAQQEPATPVGENLEILHDESHPVEEPEDSGSRLSQEDSVVPINPVEEPAEESLAVPEPIELEVEENRVEETLEQEVEMVDETNETPEVQEMAAIEPETSLVEEIMPPIEAILELEELDATLELDDLTPAIEQEVVVEPEHTVSLNHIGISMEHDILADEDKKAPMVEQEFLRGRHERKMWFRFFAGKPWHEQPEDVLEEMYMQHMAGDFLQAKSADFEEIKEELKAVINHEPEVKRDVAMEAEIRRLAWESVSDEELPASETLAKIYEEQKDYKKALRIYQKLMLKFPDRMTYFAALVENAKSKLNH